ncbi:SRPBCC family protein [[Eubacterium] cellulosolvens]
MDESIHLSAWLGCNVNQAFEMFTNKEHLMSWLPIVANIEPKTGGKYEISWTKKKPSTGCKILIYEPNKYLMFEWKSSDKYFKHSSLLDIQVTIYFLPMDCNKMSEEQFTEVHLILTSFNDLDNDKEIRLWFESTWANAFENLIDHVNDIFQ